LSAFIDPADFQECFNRNHLVSSHENVVLVQASGKGFRSSILFRREHDYGGQITIEFLLKFAHHEHEEGRVFQREFSIEHHPERSGHALPHLQFHIHGPQEENKVGRAWVTIALKNDDEYVSCIKGFIGLLAEVAEACRPGLSGELLDLAVVNRFGKERRLLLDKVAASLKSDGVEYQYPNGERAFLTPKNVEAVARQDFSLLPFFKRA